MLVRMWRKKEPLCIVGGNADWCGHYGKQDGGFSKKLKQIYLMTQQFRFWLYMQRNPKHQFEKICSSMFIPSLFTIAKIWKHPKCPSIDDQIKMQYIYIMKYYSAIKKNEILPFVTTQMDLEGTMKRQIPHNFISGGT